MKAFGGKLNRFNCRRLIKHHIDIIDGIRDIFIEINKDKTFFNEIDESYWCIKSLIVDDNIIQKTRIHIHKTMTLWR